MFGEFGFWRNGSINKFVVSSRRRGFERESVGAVRRFLKLEVNALLNYATRAALMIRRLPTLKSYCLFRKTFPCSQRQFPTHSLFSPKRVGSVLETNKSLKEHPSKSILLIVQFADRTPFIPLYY